MCTLVVVVVVVQRLLLLAREAVTELAMPGLLHSEFVLREEHAIRLVR